MTKHIVVRDISEIPNNYEGCVSFRNETTISCIKDFHHTGGGGSIYKYHRLDGPAIINDKVKLKSYYIDNKKFDEDQYWKHPLVVQNTIEEILKLA